MIFFSFPHIQYRHPPSHLPSRKKENQRFRKHFFFSFHLRCCKNENLWWFSPYPVNTTIIWPTTDRIPHFFNFQKNANQVNCRQYSCIRFCIDKLEQRTWQGENLSLRRVFSRVGQYEVKNAHGRTCNKTKPYIYLYISLYENLFENGCISISIYIYI